MGGSSSYSPPQPTQEEVELREQQKSLMAAQEQHLKDQQLLQEQERERLMHRESVTAAQEASIRSRSRRTGLIGEQSLLSSSFGGFAREGRRVRRQGGVRRTYRAPPARVATRRPGGYGRPSPQGPGRLSGASLFEWAYRKEMNTPYWERARETGGDSGVYF